MINAGIEEIIIISQDTSQYGSDLEKQNLISLLEKIDKIK
jgi:tRNA A37 methylthiotransferase MiaB